MAFGFTKLTPDNIITIFGMWRNQAIFALFMLEEAYQCLNITANLCFMKHEFARAYELSTIAISDCVDLVNACKRPEIMAMIYPTNLGYLSFFRAEIVAFIEIRNRCLLQNSSNMLIRNSEGTVVVDTADANWIIGQTGNRMDNFMYIQADGTAIRKKFSDLGTFKNEDDWNNMQHWESKVKQNW